MMCGARPEWSAKHVERVRVPDGRCCGAMDQMCLPGLSRFSRRRGATVRKRARAYGTQTNTDKQASILRFELHAADSVHFAVRQELLARRRLSPLRRHFLSTSTHAAHTELFREYRLSCACGARQRRRAGSSGRKQWLQAEAQSLPARATAGLERTVRIARAFSLPFGRWCCRV